MRRMWTVAPDTRWAKCSLRYSTRRGLSPLLSRTVQCSHPCVYEDTATVFPYQKKRPTSTVHQTCLYLHPRHSHLFIALAPKDPAKLQYQRSVRRRNQRRQNTHILSETQGTAGETRGFRRQANMHCRKEGEPQEKKTWNISHVA